MQLQKTIRFDLPDTVNDTRVLIHKYGSGNYPDPMGYPTSYQTADGQIEIKATVVTVGPGTPVKNKQVFLRVIDPKDGSLYVNGAQPGDNNDKDWMRAF